MYIDKKENQIFLIYQEIQNGAVAIYEENLIIFFISVDTR